MRAGTITSIMIILLFLAACSTSEENPLTLIGFAVNVQTDPPGIKDEVIQKVLRGRA